MATVTSDRTTPQDGVVEITDADARAGLAQLAIGRLLRICSRPWQPGDDEEYALCRAIVLDSRERASGHAPNYARDRNRGAAGD